MRPLSRFNCTSLLCLALACTGAWAQAAAQDVISLPWTERKPFQYIDADGKLKGILADLGENIFSDAGVPMKWVEVPASRIARSLATDTEKICLVGWFRTPEREKIARISLPIYRDRPQVGVARADSNLGAERGLPALMEDRSVRLVIKQGYSYGTYLDSLIAARKGEKVESVVADHTRMMAMVLRGHVDLMFLTREEIDYFAAENPRFGSEFKVISFKEFPAGNQRHILCSKAVSEETMARLDAAIRANGKIRAD